MGNFSIPKIVSDRKFYSYFSNITYVVYGILSLILFAVLGLLLPVAYKKIRRKFPCKVNCWFCNNNITVPYEFSNSWDCPHCHQYNGFSEDGGYNKIIPEQYNLKLNEGIYNTLRNSVESKENNLQTNGFCKLCNINQQLKIQQLALFVPINEEKYFEEIEQYREKLEKAYKLCSKCEKTLQETLEKQEYNLLQSRLNSHKNNSSSQKLKSSTKFSVNEVLVLMRNYGGLGLRTLSIILALLLFLALIVHFETEYHIWNLTLPGFPVLEPLLPVLKVLFYYEGKIYSFKRELSFSGLVCSFFLYYKNHTKRSQFILLAWGFLHLSLWSSYTGLQVLLSGISFLLNVRAGQNKFIKLYKKSLPVKSGFQPVKKVFPEFYDSLRDEIANPVKSMSSPLTRSDSFISLNGDIELEENKKTKKGKQGKQKLKNMGGSEDEKMKKARLREDEIESFPSIEKEKPEASTSNASQNSCFINKSILSSLETDKNSGETSGTFSEVYNTLNSLQLGGNQKKSNKPPNFLFANHNFSDVKSSSSIIKPAKFIKNLNSSWTESNECNSRSSTPSSGYSSQKPEKIDSNRYDFPKTMTPISVNSFNRHSPNSCFDYCDGNHGFYNTMNCFPPSFMPFQQFPGPVGHTTIYTCTRPTNFPFPFSPWQGFPAQQKFSPSSPRFSDASDCDNLFQESSKQFEKNKRWLKLKTIFYYFSIFLNFITVMGLVYFISTGMISVDWVLPKFHFFV